MGFASKLWYHFEILRPHNFPVPIAAAWAGASVTAGHPRLELGLAFVAMVPLLVWAAGQLLNDYFDRDADALSKPYLPIPRGDVRPEVALSLAVALDALAVGDAMFSTFNGGRPLVLGLVSLGILGTFAYSQALKASGIVGNLLMGFMVALVVLVGAAMTGQVGLAAILVALACLLNHASHNLVGAIRDVDGDRMSAIGTYAAKVGVRRSMEVALVLEVLALIVMALPGALGLISPVYLGVPAAISPFLIVRYWQVLKEPTMERSVVLFKTYRIWSILFYGSFVAGTITNHVELFVVVCLLFALGLWALVFQELQREANIVPKVAG